MYRESCDENQQVFVDVRRPAIHARRRRLPQRRRLAPGKYTAWGENLLGFGWFWAVFLGHFQKQSSQHFLFSKLHKNALLALTDCSACSSAAAASAAASSAESGHGRRGHSSRAATAAPAGGGAAPLRPRARAAHHRAPRLHLRGRCRLGRRR